MIPSELMIMIFETNIISLKEVISVFRYVLVVIY